MSGWKEKIRTELETAGQARKRGNEGMARVSARRAAGWAVKAFLEEQALEAEPASGFQGLLYLMESELVGETTKEMLEKLTSSLEKDDAQGNSYWPAEIDLIKEANDLAENLLGDIAI